MRWALVALLLLPAVPLAAQESSEAARRLVLDASRALQAGNAARFLGCFDKRETPDFPRLRENILALLAIKTVASSVDITGAEPQGDVVQLTVDWLLQLSPAEGLGSVEQRQQQVRVRVRLREKPKITLFEPVAFFGPPR